MEETKPQTILVFCAECQKEVPHTIDIDGNGEIVLTSEVTGKFLKFPKGTTGAELKVLLEKHKEDNQGQISVAKLEAHKAQLLADLKGADTAAEVVEPQPADTEGAASM